MAAAPDISAANFNLYCFDLRILPATAPTGTLEFISPLNGESNGELFLQGSGAAHTHGAGIRVHYAPPNGGISFNVNGTLSLDVPLVDTDEDGLPDVFEVDAPLAEMTTGGTVTNFGSPPGTAQAVWSRPAGSHVGQCQLTINGLRTLGQTVRETYPATFEVIAYQGSFPFQRAGDSITASVLLNRVGVPGETLRSELSFARSGEDLLTDSPWLFTDHNEVTLPTVATGEYQRAGREYSGVFVFDDFLPTTATPDYRLWLALITDNSDHDQDGVPDLSDSDFTGVVPEPPRITGFVRQESFVNLTIEGIPGQTVRLQQATSLAQPEWTDLQSVSLPEGSAGVAIPLVAQGMAFWRVQP